MKFKEEKDDHHIFENAKKKYEINVKKY